MMAAFSEWRRRGSPCGGAFVWFLRDLWAGAGWGVLDDSGLPKPCWHALKRVLQPVALLLTDEGNNGLVAHVVNERAQPLSAVLTLDAWRGDVSLAHAKTAIDVAPRGTLERNVASMLDHFVDLSDAFRFGRRSHDVVVLSLTSACGERLGQAFHFPGGLGLPVESDLGLTAQATPRDTAARESRCLRRRRGIFRGPRVDEAGEIRMQHGPCAEESVREVRRDLDTLEDDAAAAARGHVHRDGGFAASRDRGRRIGAARCDRLQVAARRAAGVRECDAKHGLAAGERRIGRRALLHAARDA